MQDARVRAALLVICLACLLGSSVVLLRGRQSASTPIVFAALPAASTPSANAPGPARPSARVYVDVAGAVRRPSLYLLPPGSRVMQAVMAAGGPSPAADMDAVNLAQPVTDGEKVFVPKRGAAASAAAAGPTAAALSPVVVPKPASSSAPDAPAVKAGKAGSRSGKITLESGEQVGLNSATLDQLERLPGVGPSMAARILAYRQQAGGFGKIEDLMLVTGIGPKKFAKIAPDVTLN